MTELEAPDRQIVLRTEKSSDVTDDVKNRNVIKNNKTNTNNNFKIKENFQAGNPSTPTIGKVNYNCTSTLINDASQCLTRRGTHLPIPSPTVHLTNHKKIENLSKSNNKKRKHID